MRGDPCLLLRARAGSPAPSSSCRIIGSSSPVRPSVQLRRSRKMKGIIVATTLILSAGFQVGAAVAGPEWEITGSGCVWSDDTSQSTFNTAGNRMEFKGSATGDIHLTCPVRVNDGATIQDFDLESGNDGDGSSTGYYVSATLRYVESGSSTDICTMYSNSSVSYDENNCNFTDFTMDTDIAHLYFYVRLHRTGTTYNPRFVGLKLY